MQTREAGAVASKFGHLAASLIGQAISATKISETSNEFSYNGNKVAIKVARAGTTSVGVTHDMLDRIHSVIGAFESTPDTFALYSLPAETYRSNMTASATGKGKVSLVTKRVFENFGTPLKTVSIDIPLESDSNARESKKEEGLNANERDRIWDEFLNTWPPERVETMSLEEYSQIGNKTTFTYWLEAKTSELGSIWGGSAYKFGIFEFDPSKKDAKANTADTKFKSDDKYSWYLSYGNTREEAFATTKQRILAVIVSARSNKLDDIVPIQLGSAFKWKIASLYQNRETLPLTPIFDKKALTYLTGAPGNYLQPMQNLKKMRGDTPFWDFTAAQWTKWDQHKKEAGIKDEVTSEDTRYWLYAPGAGGEHWDEFYSQGIMAIGWDSLGDLNQFKTKDEIAQALRNISNEPEASKKNNATSCWSFGHEMKPGDIVFAKIGRSRIIGRGIITSDYTYEPDRGDYPHVRKIEWQAKGDWIVTDDNHFALKTITEVTKYTAFIQHLITLTGDEDAVRDSEDEGENKMPSKPTNLILYGPPGTGKTWRLQNEYIRIFKAPATKREDVTPINFEEHGWTTIVTATLHLLGGRAKVGDIAEHPLFTQKAASNGRTVNLRAQVWNTLQWHTTPESETVKYARRQEPYLFNKHSDSNWFLLPDWQENSPEAKALSDLWLKLLKHGQGETPATATEDRYIFVTFHQSYSYEDFIEGIRPESDTETGELKYDVKPGVFRKICAKAKKDPAHRYAIFIDEINRGNIAKIFGELITLIEPDKRCNWDTDGKLIADDQGKKGLEITLPYSGERFGVPANLDIYGTMNTADRSIALLDIALRRRFRFQEIAPEPEAIDGIDRAGTIPDDEGGSLNLRKLLSVMNDRLLLLRDRDHMLGHSFFINCKTIEDVRDAIRDNIIPLLQEYFYDDYRRIKQVLADPTSGDEVFIHAQKLDAGKLLGTDEEAYEDRFAFTVTPSDNWSPAMLRRIYGG